MVPVQYYVYICSMDIPTAIYNGVAAVYRLCLCSPDGTHVVAGPLTAVLSAPAALTRYCTHAYLRLSSMRGPF